MPKFERVVDKYKDLRKDLYGNVEPEIKLEAITLPIERIKYNADGPYSFMKDSEYGINWKAIEMMPALAASTSYGSKEKIEGNYERAVSLNKKLISMKHDTCLESIQFNFHVSGISKGCGAQVSRHRQGQGHVSASRRFKAATPRFIYPTLDYIDDEERVKARLRMIQEINEICFGKYEHLRNEHKGYIPVGGSYFDATLNLPALHKEDARLVLPVSYATERSWFINARALRDFFRLRLAADSEWEIRRLAFMLFDLVNPLLPSIFYDIADKVGA